MDTAIKEEPYNEDIDGEDKEELMGETMILGLHAGSAFQEERGVES